MIFSAMRYLCRPSAVAVVVFFFFVVSAYGEPSAFAEVNAPDIRPRIKGYIETFDEDVFGSPSAIFVDKEHGEIYVTDSVRGEVFIYVLDGRPILRFGDKQCIGKPIHILVKDDKI